MNQDSKQKTLDNLAKAETVLVTVSQNAGIDALAAGLALYLSCIKLGKNVQIFAKAPSVDDAQRLYGVDKIGKPQADRDLVVVIKNAIENVDKVTHFLDGDDLKLVVKTFPGAKNVSKDQILFEEASVKPNVIFAVGYNSQEQLNQEIAHEQNLDPNIWLININKEDVGQLFAQVNVFNMQAASICEVIAQLFQELALPLDEDISYNLYAGIAAATENFSPALSVPLSFETASWLIKFGAGKSSFATRGQVINTGQISSINNEVAPLQMGFPQAQYQPALSSFDQTPIENVERKTTSQETWLKPPKIYKGSKSFDSEK